MDGHLARASIRIEATPEAVWSALTDPELVERYMFGTKLETDWQPGSPITWKGEFEGRAYEDKGEVIALEPARRLEVTHFSPLSGAEDAPQNYHRLVYELRPDGGSVEVSRHAL